MLRSSSRCQTPTIRWLSASSPAVVTDECGKDYRHDIDIEGDSEALQSTEECTATVYGHGCTANCEDIHGLHVDTGRSSKQIHI